MSEWIDPASLRPGDVLLMRGVGAVSDLIAWFGDSTYSHGAILVDPEHLVEAALPLSRIVPLADRLQQGDHYDFIDAYRPTRRDGRPLGAEDRNRLAAAARGLLGLGYPLDGLLQMAVIAALRNKLPADLRIRFLLHRLLDHLLREDPRQAVCSELVYRAFVSADEAGAPALSPQLVPSGQLDLPFPPIDWKELVAEWEAARKRSPTLPPAPEAGLMAAPTVPSGAEDSSVFPPLEERFARLREARRAVPVALPTLASLPGEHLPVLPDPNPGDVLPVDLETSPNLRRLGRLALTRPAA